MQATFVRGGVIYRDNGDGTATVVGYENQGTPLAPPDPAQPAETRKAEADAMRAEIEAEYARRQAAAQAAKDEADAKRARAEAERDPNAPTAAQQSEIRDRISRLNQLVRQIDRVEQLYREGPGQTSGVASVLDYLPSDANSQLDVAGAQLSQQGLAAFRVPGTGTVSDRDAMMFDRGNLPSAATRDVANEEIIRGLKARVEEELASLGQAAPRWGSTSAMDAVRTRQGGGQTAAVPARDVGTGQTTIDAYPPPMERAHDELVSRLLREGNGRIDPQAYGQQSDALFREFGFQRDPAEAARWAQGVNEYLEAGGRTIPSGIMPAERLMSGAETMRNNLVNNPVGAAMSGAANMLSLGAVEAVAPGEYAALGDAQGIPLLTGEIVGAIGGSSALGAIGRNTLGRAVPRLMQGGSGGRFARNIATDATMGGAYGAVTEGDPLTGAALAAAGSAVGQGAASGLGSAVGGLRRTPQAAALMNRGVPVSVARQLGLGRAEDLAMSIPLVGDVARARQADSFVGFNEAAFQEAGAPIGANTPLGLGRDGIDALDDAVGVAYRNALAGRSVPLDAQFGSDLAPAVAARGQLPEDLLPRTDRLIENHLTPLQDAGQLTGEMYQRARRGLGRARNNANQIAGEFDEPYRETMTGVLDAYDSLLMRGGGDDIITNLNAANQANRNLRVLEDASLDRAKVGTQTGEVNVFTPAQLLAAARRSEARYPGGDAALRQLGEEGQAVLPSTVPNSGTTDRALFAGLLGGAGVLGGGAGAASDPSLTGAAEGAAAGTGVLAAMGLGAAALGTRRGQGLLEAVLMTRPQVAQRVAEEMRRRGGLLGSAGVPIALDGM